MKRIALLILLLALAMIDFHNPLLAQNGDQTPSGSNNVAINGVGGIPGGDYDTVTTRGSARINGDLNAGAIKSTGDLYILGHAKAKLVQTTGALKVDAGLDAARADLQGPVTVKGTYLSFTGPTEAGYLKANTVDSTGTLKISASANVKNFYANGAVNISTQLDADSVIIVMYGASNIYQINSKDIDIQPGPLVGHGYSAKDYFPSGYDYNSCPYSETKALNYQGKPFPIYSKLTVDTIQGDSVYLENVQAESVDARIVRLGPGCCIQNLHYSQTLIYNPKVVIFNQQKIIR